MTSQWCCGFREIGSDNALKAMLVLLLLFAAPATAQQEIRFGVLGLFHSRELVLQPEGGQILSIAAQGVEGSAALVLNGEPGHRQIVFRAEGDRVVAGSHSAGSWTAAARDGGAAAFRLTVPGRFHRVYRGRLTIEARKGELLAVVAMDRETAVASIVAAEMAENAPLEALKAQAVATRSFLAGSRGPDTRRFEVLLNGFPVPFQRGVMKTAHRRRGQQRTPCKASSGNRVRFSQTLKTSSPARRSPKPASALA